MHTSAKGQWRNDVIVAMVTACLAMQHSTVSPMHTAFGTTLRAVQSRYAGPVTLWPHNCSAVQLSLCCNGIKSGKRFLYPDGDPDRHQDLICCSSASQKISCTSVWKFLRKVADKQTDKHQGKHILVGGGNDSERTNGCSYHIGNVGWITHRARQIKFYVFVMFEWLLNLCNIDAFPVYTGDCRVAEKTDADCHGITDCTQSNMQPVDVLETFFLSQ